MFWVWPLVPVPQRKVRMIKINIIFTVRSPHFGDHKCVKMGGGRLSMRWYLGSHVTSEHSDAAV